MPKVIYIQYNLCKNKDFIYRKILYLVNLKAGQDGEPQALEKKNNNTWAQGIATFFSTWLESQCHPRTKTRNYYFFKYILVDLLNWVLGY